ncbi:hypothetical protein, variant [Batrachochytrium dendrobatidis JEL423]|uniref:Septin-type G domain-containing protein n=1 Tax=Batrachochytrium dendrobatidis (strain JEL423) TaxID=403673 RepID=A0A177W926_BATDL|nr:hypothetical protein BDEG_20742 [Batrachochytrium dendrobatidis JEL423]OAJ36580.1 hypothetical protein, variant [Batrachochytrium dendrobatidis JEL423]
MVVGESGLGKSTLVNTLFGTILYPLKEAREPSPDTPKTVEVQSISADLEENGVKLKLTCIDTPGFGDFVNNEESWRPILENIEARFDAFLEQENRVNRKRIIDTRVHACLYFIAPTGHSLKPLDIEFMKRLAGRVNLIPVIAKSDTLTEEEIKAFKARPIRVLGLITIYPTLGSDKEVEVAGKKIRGRKYPWGIIEVDNETHCDFVKLRQMLIRTHMEELKENTNEVLYEHYRMQKLAEVGPLDNVESGVSPLSKFEQERLAHEQKMAKMEAEMKAVFQQKVAEKEAKLKQSEDELYARHREMKEQLERQRIELDDRKKSILTGRPMTPDKAKKSKGLFK